MDLNEIGRGYLDELCLFIYREYGVSIDDYSEDKKSILDMINGSNLKLYYDIPIDAKNFIDVCDGLDVMDET